MSTQLTLIDLPHEGQRGSVRVDDDEAVMTAALRRRAVSVPGQELPCGWCGTPMPTSSRGRPRKWCSATCRHRAWEQRRAAASGLSAIEIVEHIIEKVVTDKVTETIEVPVLHPPQTAAEFADTLTDLATRLDTGRIYDRDLRIVELAAVTLIDALRRRIITRR